MTVEPGEIHHETAEFIVTSGVKTVLVYSYFRNPSYRKGSKSVEGWTATSGYDINDHLQE